MIAIDNDAAAGCKIASAEQGKRIGRAGFKIAENVLLGLQIASIALRADCTFTISISVRPKK
jgi:hypothetical protein